MGLGASDLIDSSVRRGKIVLVPKLVIERGKFPTDEDEYTPAQRRAIDRGITQSLKEYKQGRGSRQFEIPQSLMASLHRGAKLRAKKGRRAVQ